MKLPRDFFFGKDAIRVVPRKHHVCRGVGCSECMNTGNAGIAFIHNTRRIGLAGNDGVVRMGSINDADQDRVIDIFSAAAFGEDTERSGQVLTVLQHTVDREAMDAAWRWAGQDGLFNWLCAQELLHCRFRTNV